MMKFLKRYKEIWFGIGLGIVAWLLDAVMHVELGADVHSGGLLQEIFTPHPTALIFRGFYVAIAMAFGVFLWRANWRERQLRSLEQSLIAFQRRLDIPTLRLMASARQLRARNSVRLDETAEALAAGIVTDAGLIDDLARKHLEFSRLVQAGQTAEAIETLQSIESWLAERDLISK